MPDSVRAAFRVVAPQAESAYQALDFTCRIQRMLHRVENASGVLRNGGAANRSGHRLVLVLRQQRLEAGVIAQRVPHGINSEHRNGGD